MGCVQSKQITCPSCYGNKKTHENQDIISSLEREVVASHLQDDHHIIVSLLKDVVDSPVIQTADSSNNEPTQQPTSVLLIRKHCRNEEKQNAIYTENVVQNNQIIVEDCTVLSIDSTKEDKVSANYEPDSECEDIVDTASSKNKTNGAKSNDDVHMASTVNNGVHMANTVNDGMTNTEAEHMQDTNNYRDIVVDMLLIDLLKQVVNVVSGSNSTQDIHELHKEQHTDIIQPVNVDNCDMLCPPVASNVELFTAGNHEKLSNETNEEQKEMDYKHKTHTAISHQTIGDSIEDTTLPNSPQQKSLTNKESPPCTSSENLAFTVVNISKTHDYPKEPFGDSIEDTTLPNSPQQKSLNNKESPPCTSSGNLAFTVVNISKTRDYPKEPFGDTSEKVSKEVNALYQPDELLQRTSRVNEEHKIDDNVNEEEQAVTILSFGASRQEDVTELLENEPPKEQELCPRCKERSGQYKIVTPINTRKEQELCAEKTETRNETATSISLQTSREKNINTKLNEIVAYSQMEFKTIGKQYKDKELYGAVNEECSGRDGVIEPAIKVCDGAVQKEISGGLSQVEREEETTSATVSLDEVNENQSENNYTDITAYLESSEDERFLPSPPSFPSSTSHSDSDMWPSNSAVMAVSAKALNDERKAVSYLKTAYPSCHDAPVSSGGIVESDDNKQTKNEFDDEQIEAIATVLYHINLVREQHGLGPISTSSIIQFLMAREFNTDLAFTLYMNYQTHINNYPMTSPFKDPLRKELVSGHFTLMEARKEGESATAILYAQRCTQRDHKIVMQSIRFQLDEALQNIMVRKYGIVLLYDFTDITFNNCDLKLCTKILDMIMNAYPVKVHRVFVISPPLWFKPVMNVLSTILQQHNNIQTINRQQLPQSMAGSCIAESLGGTLRHEHMTWINQCFFAYSSRMETGKECLQSLRSSLSSPVNASYYSLSRVGHG